MYRAKVGPYVTRAIRSFVLSIYAVPPYATVIIHAVTLAFGDRGVFRVVVLLLTSTT